MTSDELGVLLSDGLIQLGAHTVTHPSLTQLSAVHRREELGVSHRQCDTLAGHRIDGFAYPYGDVNSEVRSDVRAQGFRWACSTEGRYLDDDNIDVFALPRIAAPNATDGFARMLSDEQHRF